MIKGITSGPGLNVLGGNTSLPYVNMSTGNQGNPMQGMLRLHGSDMQVFDGTSWMTLGTSYATVELNGETQTIIEWARKKRNEEAEWEALSKDHPAVKIALDNLERAKQQVKVTATLCKDTYETDGMMQPMQAP
jgi:hypothetical protein